LGSVWLQEFVADGWKTLEISNLVKTTNGATSNFTTHFTPLNFVATGLHIIRQYIPASARYSEFRGKPSTLIVLEPTVAEPTVAAISDAKFQSEKILQEFDARAAARIAAEKKRLVEVAAAKAKITCLKGKNIKIVKGPKCPSGYTKKK